MNTHIEETMLMRQSKADVVEVLNGIFPTHGITASTPLSVVAKYMQWAVGLLSIDLATVNVNTGEQAFFTYEDWTVMTSNQRANYKQCGLRLRAEGQEFIIAKTSLGSQSWGPTNIDVDGLKDYEGVAGMLDDWDGQGNTEKIVAAANSTGQTFNAAVKCSDWKSSTLEADGYEDPQQWYLPSIAQLNLIQKYLIAINTEMSRYSFGAIGQTDHWSSTEYNQAGAWRYVLGSGAIVCGYNKNGSFAVRPCSAVLVPAM